MLTSFECRPTSVCSAWDKCGLTRNITRLKHVCLDVSWDSCFVGTLVAVPRNPREPACRPAHPGCLLTDVYRALSVPTHHPSFDLFCHRCGRRRNHRLLLCSKMKTEIYRNRGFFLKTEPKSTDHAKCKTVTTLHAIQRMLIKKVISYERNNILYGRIRNSLVRNINSYKWISILFIRIYQYFVRTK